MKQLKQAIKQSIKYFMLKWYLPYVYSRATKKPLIDTKVVFIEATAKSLSNNFRIVYEKLENNYSLDLHIVYLRKTKTSYFGYFNNCKKLLQEVATAKYVFLNEGSNILSCAKLRKETKVAQLWHGCGAFKKFGMSTAELIFGGSRKEQSDYPLHRHYELVTISSPEVQWAYAEAMVLEDQKEIIKPLGLSRTDIFFDQEFLANAKKEIFKEIPECKGKKIILYAPTFRGRVLSAEAPQGLNIKPYRDAFLGEYVLLIKHHPHIKKPPLVPEGFADFAYLIDSSLSIDTLMAASDICITDYSSLVFEYSLLEKPLLFFAYDIEEYDDWRGFYYPYEEFTPGPVCKTNEEVVARIKDIEKSFDRQQIADFRDKFMQSCDGNSTEKIFDNFFRKDLEPLRKPTALETLCKTNQSQKDISIIVPVFNGMPELTKALQSIVDQTYPLDRIEAMVVDDGSSDNTWNEIQRFANTYPELFVIKKLDAPSGSPAKPRNVAISLARGEYLFCLDADDWLGPQAVEKMLDHAIRWGSDVLYVKMVSADGRHAPQSMFTHNQPRADLYDSKVLWSLSPTKLFKKDLIKDNDVFFFEAGMPEDQHFVLKALLHAAKISVASDYDYYYIRWREDSTAQTSLKTWDCLDSNLTAFTELFCLINNFIPKEDQNKILLRRIFERDVYFMFLSLVKNYQEDQWQEYGTRMNELFKPYYLDELVTQLKAEKRPVLDSGLSGDYQALRLLGERPEISEDIRLNCDLNSVQHNSPSVLTFSGTAATNLSSLSSSFSFQVIIRERNGGNEAIFECRSVPAGETEIDSGCSIIKWDCCCDVSTVKKKPRISFKRSRWDVFLKASCNSYAKEIRIGKSSTMAARFRFLSESKKIQKAGFLNPYVTEFGNFSFLLGKK